MRDEEQSVGGEEEEDWKKVNECAPLECDWRRYGKARMWNTLDVKAAMTGDTDLSLQS